MNRFTVLLAGRVKPTDALLRRVAGTRIVAADGGIVHARALRLQPELWVGDFDSVPDGDASWDGVPRLWLPRDKARTDGEAAVDAALERGGHEVLLVGALGGPRSDHAFSNLVLLLACAERGVTAELFDGHERAVALGPAPRRVEAEPGTQFSVLKFSDVAGLTITGAKWPLRDASVPFPSLLTQSNEALGTIEASARHGRAVLLLQADPGTR